MRPERKAIGHRLIQFLLQTDFISRNIVTISPREVSRKNNRIRKQKLSEPEIIEIKSLLLNGISGEEIAEYYRITSATVSHIANGRTWSHIFVDGV